jgi:CheY-like chemotaxis protein
MLPYAVKMLVADDSKTVQLFFRKIVERSRWPIEFLAADNGRECLMLLEQGGIDLAFIDINMPEMSGMEAVSRVRFKGNKTFIALMSGKASLSRFEVARQIQAYEYLVKPFSEAQVEDIIKTYRHIAVLRKTLIVDDNRTIRRIIRRVLDRSAFRLAIEEAASGERAVKNFAESNYDLVFLDYHMPGLNGIETLEQLRARSSDVKVIMISAERDETHVRAALDKGASSFLHKPFFASDIDRALHNAFGLKLPGLATFDADNPVANIKSSPSFCPVDPGSMQVNEAFVDEAISWEESLVAEEIGVPPRRT